MPEPTMPSTATSAVETTTMRMEPTVKRIRAVVDGVVLADTTHAWMVWESPYYPMYYLPQEDFSARLVSTADHVDVPGVGTGLVHDVQLPDTAETPAPRSLPGVVTSFPDAPDPRLAGLVRLEWGAMDQWFEEDEPVYTHPRNPYTRVDILASSRHVRIEVDGETVADSVRPRLLFETGLPVRYYLPFTDVRMDLLRPSDTRTHCPYKGEASYYSVQVHGRRHPDLAWTYRTPLPESVKIAGLVAFLDERVDVYLDGERQVRPRRR